MRIYDLTCTECGATYSVAEAATLAGEPSAFGCTICGREIMWLESPKYRVCRLAVPSDLALHPPIGARAGSRLQAP